MKNIKVSLVDLMAMYVGCEYVSDLHQINDIQRMKLAEILKKIAANDEDLFDWNDALEYISGKSKPHTCAEEAKAALIAALTEKHIKP